MCSKISFIDKSFVVIEVLSLSFIWVYFQYRSFPSYPLATTIMVLIPVSCYMTSFNYGGKKARDVGLTCRCHLSNIMPDSIFYDNIKWGITCLFFRVITTVFFSIKEMDSVVLSL